jgi:hypothetical protein
VFLTPDPSLSPMSPNSHFRHQTYTAAAPAVLPCLLTQEVQPSVDSEDFQQRMQTVGDVFRRNDVAAVYLVHGTFMGADALGILAELARILPSASRAAHRAIKKMVDKVTGETGNYTARYAKCFETAINDPQETHIPVQLFNWSSENNHIGRADGAVRFIDELASLDLAVGKRVLLWGHSHAGNLFALMTNLLGENRSLAGKFFAAAEVYYRWPMLRCVDIPVWDRVREMLGRERSPLEDRPLDVVTFGTPVRYGWDSRGYSRLLHFVNHRPVEGLPEYQAPFPPKLEDVMGATNGDYIQQLGIAGTNIMPSLFSWRAWLADHRLNRLLQDNSQRRRSLERFKAGVIVPDEGTTLLVDYGPAEGSIAQHLAGHAVYTRKEWLLFHAEEVARRIYEGA